MRQNVVKFGRMLVLIAFGLFGLSIGNLSADAPAHEFIGAKKCSICHKTDKQGKQFQIWQDSKHSKAYETLGTQAAKDAGAARGVTDPQNDVKCLKCHSTAYYFTEAKVTDAIPVEEGISCESCHGPGKDYMKKSVMEDKNQAIANGLVMPDENTCKKCHNPESPTYKPFDYKERWEKIKHPVTKE